MPESVHEFEELWVDDGEHSQTSSQADQAKEDAITTPSKAAYMQPEASDDSEATSKSTHDAGDTPTARPDTGACRRQRTHRKTNTRLHRSARQQPGGDEPQACAIAGSITGRWLVCPHIEHVVRWRRARTLRRPAGAYAAPHIVCIPHNPQQGTSAPIRIPARAVPGRGTDEASGEKRFASTFVPPHLMEQQQQAHTITGAAATYSGVSPSASLKRERLYQRNAILRSTGFIETNPIVRHSFAETLDTIKEGQFLRDAPRRGPSQLEASALSAALDNLVEAPGV